MSNNKKQKSLIPDIAKEVMEYVKNEFENNIEDIEEMIENNDYELLDHISNVVKAHLPKGLDSYLIVYDAVENHGYDHDDLFLNDIDHLHTAMERAAYEAVRTYTYDMSNNYDFVKEYNLKKE